MTNRPLVSIALCTYNGAEYLDLQLQTLLQQTYTNLELVVVDDRSSDRTIDIVMGYAAADARIKLFINEKNLGYVKNFETAIGYCTGNYIALADQDDSWALNKIETLLDNADDAILIYHDSEFTDNTGTSLGRMSGLLNMYSGSSPLPFLFYNCISGHSCMFRKELVQKLGPFNPKFYHDWWIAYVAGNAGKINYVNQPLVKYRQHQKSNTDILNRKEKLAQQGPKYAEINILWLKNCLTIDSKYNGLIEQIIYLHEHRSMLNSMRLMQLLLKNYRELFYLKKKSTISKLNYIRKMVFFNRADYYTL